MRMTSNSSDKERNPWLVLSETGNTSSSDDEENGLGNTDETLQWLDEHCDWRPFGVEW